MSRRLTTGLYSGIIASLIFVAGASAAAAFASNKTHRAYSPPQIEPCAKQRSDQKDPLLDKAWHLKRIGAFQAWRTTMGDHRTTIAIVDSGLHYNDPDLCPNLKFN